MKHDRLQIIPAYDRPQELGQLFREYQELLVTLDEDMIECLAVQNYDTELLHLEEKYGRPAGQLYIAYYDGALAGCIALRRMDETRCELKRVFVRPAFRGKKLGKALLEQVVCDAKAFGYRYMLLDTLPSLPAAIAMYERCGFYRIGKYNDNPMRRAIYMQLDL